MRSLSKNYRNPVLLIILIIIGIGTFLELYFLLHDPSDLGFAIMCVITFMFLMISIPKVWLNDKNEKER